MDFNFFSPTELCRDVARRARELRLSLGLRQEDLAAKAGVTLSTLKRFERSGEVGFEVVVRISVALSDEAALGQLFLPRMTESLDELLARQRKPQRARRKRPAKAGESA